MPKTDAYALVHLSSAFLPLPTLAPEMSGQTRRAGTGLGWASGALTSRSCSVPSMSMSSHCPSADSHSPPDGVPNGGASTSSRACATLRQGWSSPPPRGSAGKLARPKHAHECVANGWTRSQRQCRKLCSVHPNEHGHNQFILAHPSPHKSHSDGQV